MKIKHLFVSILLVTGFQPMIAQSALRQQFVNSPVQEARPWTFWYWMFGAVTPEGITADLEAYKRAGVGGVVYYDQVHGKGEHALPAFSVEWWEMLKFAASEAKRVGLSFEINLSNGYVAGGPWITKALSMQRLTASDTIIRGKQQFCCGITSTG